MLKLKLVFGFYYKSLCWLSELWQPVLEILVMTDIEDGWQHVEVEDWFKLSGVWFLLPVSMLTQ